MPEQKTIEHKYSNHQQQLVDNIDFANDTDLVEVVNQFDGVWWNQTMCCWYITKLQFDLTKMLESIRGNAWVYYTALKYLKKAKLWFRLERQREMNTLPKVIIKKDVQQIHTHCYILKYRCILSIVYAAGLWWNQLKNLKITNILWYQKQMQIINSQGFKNAYSLLSANSLNDQRDYFKAFRPQYWLFEGKLQRKQYCATSLVNILSEACRFTGIKRRVTLHVLRHFFPKHLLEQWVDLRNIQEFLGHSSTITTEVYTYVLTSVIGLIRNSLDDILGCDP